MSTTLLLALTLVLTCACNKNEGEEKEHHINYLAVQKDKDSHWSIIDGNGNVIVKEEYEPECGISKITDDGLYWVLSNKKYMLYSIDSPKQPITSREFDAVLPFYSGRTFVVEEAGKQIELIDDKGNTIKILPKNITGVLPFKEGLAQFENANGKCGYLNTDGEVAIEAKYAGTQDFSDGYAIVQKKLKDDYTIIDTNGKEISTIKYEKYCDLYSYSEGIICCTKNKEDEEVRVVAFIDAYGKECLTLSKKIRGGSGIFMKDRAIICDYENDFKNGLIKKNGEFAIRIGKYDNIDYVGDGAYTVKKEDKYGIVDGDDNEIIGFDYDGAMKSMLGDHFVMKDGKEYILVNRKGEEVRGSDFVNYSSIPCSYYLKYYDVDNLSKKVADNFSADGYVPLKGATSPKAIAKRLGESMESCRWSSDFTHATDSGDVSVITTIKLDEIAVKTKYRTETINDGWFEYQRQVEDGLMWNDNARISEIQTTVTLTDERMADTFAKRIIPMLKQRGFNKEVTENCFSSKKSYVEIVKSGSVVFVTLRYN